MKQREMIVGSGGDWAGLVGACVRSFKKERVLGRCVVVVPNSASVERVKAALVDGAVLLNVDVVTVEKAAELVLAGAGDAGGLGLPGGAERLLVRRLIGDGGVYASLSGSAGFLGALAGNMRDLIDAGVVFGEVRGARLGLRDLLGLASEYQRLRGQLGVDDDSARFVRAAELIGAGRARLGECVVMAGVYDPTGLQEAFLTAALVDADFARVVLPGYGFGAGFRKRLGVALELSAEALVSAEPGMRRLDWLRGNWDRDGAGDLPKFGADDDSVDVVSVPGGSVGAELMAREVAGMLDRNTGLQAADVELVSRGTGGIPGDVVVRELVRLGVPCQRGAGSLGETHVGRVLLGLVELLAAPRVARGRLMDLVDDLPWRADAVAFGKDGEAGVRVVDAGERALWDRLGRGADLRVVIDQESSAKESGRLVLARARGDEKDAARAFGAWTWDLARLHGGIRAAGLGDSDSGWERFGVRLVNWMTAWMRPDAQGFSEWSARLLGLGRFDGVCGLDAAGLGWVLGGLGREAFGGEVLDQGGVRVSKLGQRRGARAQVVVLLDGDEGSFPLAPAANVLLGDGDRELLGEGSPSLLNGTGAGRELEERAMFAELLAMAEQRLVLVTTRAGIEKTGATPSRLVLEAMGILRGDGVRLAPACADVAEAKDDVPGLRRLELASSWRGGFTEGEDAGALREQLLWAADAALLGGADATGVRAALGATEVVGVSNLDVEVGRYGALGHSRFDGQLGPDVLQRLGAEGAFRGTPEKGMSPSRIETFAGCGMRAYLQSILGLREHDMPEENRGILAVERGKRVHEILEIFGKAAAAAGLDVWERAPFADLRGLLFKAIAKVIAKAKKLAPDDQTGLWEAEALRYRGLLLGWLGGEIRSGGGWQTSEFEWDFEQARFELREPRDDEDTAAPLYLRGQADRLDTRQIGGADGALEVRVVDYKTGKGTEAKNDSTSSGRSLQLALYGAAARAKLGAQVSEGLYDFVFYGRRIRWTGVGALNGPRSLSQTDDTARRQVRAIVESMEDGVFWPSPRKDGKPNQYDCKSCGMREACGPWREEGFMSAGDADPVVAALANALEVEGEGA